MKTEIIRDGLGNELKLRDMLGKNVYAGDILIELGRGSFSTKKTGNLYSLMLWEIPFYYDGHGYKYNMEGEKYIFAWASVSNSLKVDISLLPEGFEYSFRNGVSEFNTTIEKGSLVELIENSDWEEYKINNLRG